MKLDRFFFISMLLVFHFSTTSCFYGEFKSDNIREVNCFGNGGHFLCCGWVFFWRVNQCYEIMKIFTKLNGLLN